MTIIRVKPNTMIIELTEGSTMPLFARMQSSIVVEADRQGDDRDGYIYQFIYNDRIWTIGAENVEVLS